MQRFCLHKIPCIVYVTHFFNAVYKIKFSVCIMFVCTLRAASSLRDVFANTLCVKNAQIQWKCFTCIKPNAIVLRISICVQFYMTIYILQGPFHPYFIDMPQNAQLHFIFHKSAYFFSHIIS